MKRGSRNECSFGGYECLDRSSSKQIATTYDITSSHDHRLFFLLIGDIILPIRRSNILLYPIRCATSIAVSGREALSGRFPACIVAKCQRFVRCRHCLLSLDEDNTLYHRHFPLCPRANKNISSNLSSPFMYSHSLPRLCSLECVAKHSLPIMQQ